MDQKTRSVSIATTIIEKEKPKVTTIPLKLIIIVSLCVFTVAPAIVLWILSWQEGQKGINNIETLSTTSIQVRLFFIKSLHISNFRG